MEKNSKNELGISEKPEETRAPNIGELLAGSPYLKTIAVLIFVSVIVSTLIDFQFKSAAKQAYPLAGALADFFELLFRLAERRHLLRPGCPDRKNIEHSRAEADSLCHSGNPSYRVSGHNDLAWPSCSRADENGRWSVARESLPEWHGEPLYAASGKVKKTAKTFLDVVIERTGDATAGFIILVTLSFTAGYYTFVQLICVAMIVSWILMIAFLRTRDLEPLNAELESQGLAPTNGQAVDK